jgi:hypothetical protein
MVHGTGLLLLSAVAGYLVLERAAKQKNGLRRVGQAVGWFVLVVSLLGVLCKVGACIGMGGMCSTSGKRGGMCPITGKSGGMMGKPMVPAADK